MLTTNQRAERRTRGRVGMSGICRGEAGGLSSATWCGIEGGNWGEVDTCSGCSVPGSGCSVPGSAASVPRFSVKDPACFPCLISCD